MVSIKTCESVLWLRTNYLPLLAFYSRDITTVKITIETKEGRRNIISSIYLPNDSEELPTSKELEEVANFCAREKEFAAREETLTMWLGDRVI